MNFYVLAISASLICFEINLESFFSVAVIME